MEAGTSMDTRLIVTGHDDKGKAVVASDELVAPSTLSMVPGIGFNQLWGSDMPQAYPDDGAVPHTLTYVPPVGGFRFLVTTMAPESDADEPVDMEQAFEEAEAKLPGLIGHMDPNEPGMHTTPTTDFDVLLSGTVVLELDDGAEVTLSPGDVVIQNGTRHRWRNPGTSPAVLITAMVGAQQA